jgi:hypothetical protein
LQGTGITNELEEPAADDEDSSLSAELLLDLGCFAELLDFAFFSEELETDLVDEELRDSLDLFNSFAEEELFCFSALLDSGSELEMTEEESSPHAIKSSTAKTSPSFFISYPSNFQPQSLW